MWLCVLVRKVKCWVLFWDNWEFGIIYNVYNEYIIIRISDGNEKIVIVLVFIYKLGL